MTGDLGRDLDLAMWRAQREIDDLEAHRDGHGGQAQRDLDRDAGDRYEKALFRWSDEA